jgi:hypothetical protein
MTTLEHATAYSLRGWSIVPVKSGKKEVAVPWTEFQKRVPTPDELRQWFAGTGAFCVFAVVLGPISGRLACRDFDIGKSYDDWAEKYHEWACLLPTVRTAKGAHVYFRMATASPLANASIIKYKDGELRIARGICLLPPCLHPTGHRYEWIIPLPPGPLTEIDPCEIGMQGELAVLKDEKGQIPDKIVGGQRNNTLTRIAGIMRRPGLSQAAIEAALHKENADRCDPPLSDDEVESIARSVAQYSPAEAEPTHSGIFVFMDSVPRETVEWIWNPWLPLGKLSILEGDPKVGKTTIALQLCAIISRGWPFPDVNGRPGTPFGPAPVIFLNAEDGLGDTLGPRLDHAQADCSKIAAMTAIRVKEGAKVSERMVTLQDVQEIEQVVAQIGAKLIVVDPIQAYFGAKVDMHRANETRPVLAALGAMAIRQKCAVLIIRHLRKSGGRAIESGMGSIDLSGAARSIMVAVKNPDDPQKRILAHTACNLALESKSIGYTLIDGFAWTGVDERSADELSNTTKPATPKGAKADEAANWLETLLTTAPMAANEIIAKARREGFGRPCIDAAKIALQIESVKHGPLWFWQLPNS